MINPTENSLFDLPDYEQIEDEQLLPLPPPDSPGENTEEALVNGEPEKDKLSQAKNSPVTARKTVKRSVPKLDAERLVSERGLPALQSMFDNVKFKGKGHEAADLKTLMRYMEHWAHRLFPKVQFEEFVGRVERLGNKQAVQACLKRIRLDLPISHEEFTSNEGEEDGNNGVSAATEELDFFSEIQNTRDEFHLPPNATLTEEQQQRIEKNRQLALEKRRAKTQFNSESQEHELCVSQLNEEHNTVVSQIPDDNPAADTGSC
ncbi:TIMELESS-interacting protein [Varanus komodoensis]|uniref:TIMELESS-interacting protein n=1 Tax=Varanus komodoensis TaxID=61221 RepID=A0A8D2LSP2_VARKO|nr:TIMELESS-interacting protein [Varanus komodoensis]XP_044300947.1 TIMELESS-interacting protein [Varanus komodoensis]